MQETGPGAPDSVWTGGAFSPALWHSLQAHIGPLIWADSQTFSDCTQLFPQVHGSNVFYGVGLSSGVSSSHSEMGQLV